MFSNDKNIEDLATLVEKTKEYVELEKKLFQLNAIEKTVRVLSMLLLTIILGFFALLVVIFLTFAVAHALSELMHPTFAYLTIAGFYILLFILFYAKRSTWIQRPLIKLFAEILTT